MHGGLHVEMASFFVSRIVGGLRVTAERVRLFRCNSLSSCHQADFERWVDDRNFQKIIAIPDPFGTDFGRTEGCF